MRTKWLDRLKNQNTRTGNNPPKLTEVPMSTLLTVLAVPSVQTKSWFFGAGPDDREERAGILEFDAGFSRAEAEHRAGLN